MRPFASTAVVLTALVLILGLSIASAMREQDRLMREFTATTRQQAHASVESLAARLDALDQDTRMLLDLVELSKDKKAAKDYDARVERRVWESAFRALAVVVSQYRALALVDADGAIQVLAVDPTEPATTVDGLEEPTVRLAREVSARGARALGAPARVGGRSFLLYGAPLAGGGAVVVASDAAIFLGAVAWTPLPVARLYVTDPAGVVWADCETRGGCRAITADQIPSSLPAAPAAEARRGSRGSRGVEAARPAIQVSERLDRPTGAWLVTWVASTEALLSREWSLLARIVLTALAAALAVAGIGLVVMRQQRKAVTLESRLEVAQALASARQTSQSIVENAPLGVLGVSQDRRVVLANTFLTDRVGPIRIGAPLREAFSGAGARWLAQLEPRLEAALRDGADDSAVHRELHAISTEAHQLFVRVVPVHDDALGVRAFALVEDQSELRNLENQLVRAEKLITVGVLSAGIAHEIGSPLAVIRGRAEQVLRHLGAGAGTEDTRVIIKHIDNISRTIRQLLDFSRRQAVAPSPVPLAVAVDRARALLQWKLEARRVSLDVALDDDLPMLAADPDQLEQVLVNLLLNACDASDAGAAVALTARAGAAGEVRLEVVDHGCGILAEHMNAVFDPFFTTKKRGEGTGLGLTIVAGIVRNHGGRINLASVPGKGTTVTVAWPVAQQKVARAHA
ncbi:MAG TPA: ATP-binding protein [Polyangia bacterium]|nr:ATP-binding protein [Polyangia bacterium]